MRATFVGRLTLSSFWRTCEPYRHVCNTGHRSHKSNSQRNPLRVRSRLATSARTREDEMASNQSSKTDVQGVVLRLRQAQLFRATRQRAGMSREEVTRRLGWPPSRLGSLESGAAEPTLE